MDVWKLSRIATFSRKQTSHRKRMITWYHLPESHLALQACQPNVKLLLQPERKPTISVPINLLFLPNYFVIWWTQLFFTLAPKSNIYKIAYIWRYTINLKGFPLIKLIHCPVHKERQRQIIQTYINFSWCFAYKKHIACFITTDSWDWL